MAGRRLTKLSRSIAGRRAVVTGAASGMGRATAALFADEGAVVGLVDRDAGVSLVSSAFQDDESFEQAWHSTMEVNLAAQARLVRHVLPSLRASGGGGRVVNIASTEAFVTTAGLMAYAASKAAVVGITRSLAVELGRHGITVNCICPGPIHTGMTAGIGDEAKETYARRRVPLRRYGDPEEVAHMTLSLCLPAASFVNGAVLVVDGGMSIRHT